MRSSSAFAFASSSRRRLISASADPAASDFAASARALASVAWAFAVAAVTVASFACATALAASLVSPSDLAGDATNRCRLRDVLARTNIAKVRVERRDRGRDRRARVRRIEGEERAPVCGLERLGCPGVRRREIGERAVRRGEFSDERLVARRLQRRRPRASRRRLGEHGPAHARRIRQPPPRTGRARASMRSSRGPLASNRLDRYGALRDARRTARAGSVIVNVVPTPGVLSHVIVPPCASTICFAMASPKPVPAAPAAR